MDAQREEFSMEEYSTAEDEGKPPNMMEAKEMPLDEEVQALAGKVFGIELIRDIIFQYAIIPETRGYMSTVHALRWLRKDWNDSVCKLLQKNCWSLKSISLGKRNPSTKSLETFTPIFNSSSDILGRDLTYSLTLYRTMFRRENHSSLYKFLLGCGTGLVSLNLEIPRNGGSLKGIFPNLSLPSLQTMFIALASEHFTYSSPKEKTISHSDNIAYLLQSIFSGATALKEINISHNGGTTENYQSLFEYIVLPASIRSLTIAAKEISEDIEMLLLKNSLPNLQSLALTSVDPPLRTGLLSRILESYRPTLKCLQIRDPNRSFDPRRHLFRFPLMPNLEILQIEGNFFALEPRIQSLETYLPKLRVLELIEPSLVVLQEWTNGSTFSSVEDLNILVHPNVADPISGISSAFPNVTKLKLQGREIPISGLQTVFMEMCKLTDLELRIFGKQRNDNLKDILESVLIGAPVEFVARLRTTPGDWANVEINEDGPSIRKLKELRSFTLESGVFSRAFDWLPLISDISFHFGFLKMPRLQKLDFNGHSWASKEMEEKWKNNGRIFIPPRQC